jgi:hypothetical protein
MRVYRIPVMLIVIVINFTSCRELYFPDDIRSLDQTLVIRGIICDGSSPAVNITYAMGYYESTEIPVSNATVYIIDNLGNQVGLPEESAGSYRPASDEFKGVTGRTYALHVITSDGNEYESDPVRINEKAVIDSLYAQAGELDIILYNPDGEPYMDKIREGLHLYADVTGTTNSTAYCRFNTSVIRLYGYLVNTFGGSVSYYVWDSPSVVDNFYSVDYTNSDHGRQILSEHKIGYLPWNFPEDLPPNAFSVTTYYVLILKVYSISAEAYDYYYSVDRQLNSDNQMFAPIPSQINSNIRCVNDPVRTVTGVFEASTMTAAYNAILYLEKDKIRSKTLTEFPDTLGSGFQTVNPPDFWIYF